MELSLLWREEEESVGRGNRKLKYPSRLGREGDARARDSEYVVNK
jgi:hypothetical protein